MCAKFGDCSLSSFWLVEKQTASMFNPSLCFIIIIIIIIIMKFVQKYT